MFGLAGYISSKSGNIKKMLERTSNFPEGNISEYKHNNCVMGTKQLSRRFDGGMIEYEGAEGFAIAFSGKIYNYIQIKNDLSINPKANSDAELIILGYKTIGKDIFKKINGMFALAIYDEAKDEMIIARDGCGMRPMYYYHSNDDFVFASNTKAFEEFDGFNKEFNQNILSAFLCFGSVPTKETFIKNVFRLEPGHSVTFSKGQTEKECFFNLEFNSKDKNIEEIAQDIHKACTDSITAHATDNFATFLSSGVDSSYIASVAKPKITYTAGYTDQKYDESVYTKELADILGIENRIKTVSPEEYLEQYKVVISSMDEPLSNPSVSSIYFGAQAAAETADIIISGEGADELFGGYNSYKEEITHSSYMKIPYFIRHLIYLCTKWIPGSKFDFFARRGQKLKDFHIGLDRVFKETEARKIINFGNQVSTKNVTAEYYDKYKNCSTMEQRQAIDFYFWLINDFVHCVVRSAEHFEIQSRFPLLGKEVINVAMTVPNKYKLYGGMTKAAFRMAAKKAIPNDAHSRKKLGFPVPLKEWIKRDDFYNEIKNKFQSETAKKFFKTSEIMNMLENHKNGNGDYYKKVWTIYTFILWYDLNF